MTAVMTASPRTICRIWRREVADGAQEPELARALVDRQRERVDDAEEGDDHRQREQRVEDVEDLADLSRPASR